MKRLHTWIQNQIEDARLRRACWNVQEGFAYFGFDLSDLRDEELIARFEKVYPILRDAMHSTGVMAQEASEAISRIIAAFQDVAEPLRNPFEKKQDAQPRDG